MNHILKTFSGGLITLPKKRREKNPSDYYMAVETPDGLLIAPVLFPTVKSQQEKSEKKEAGKKNESVQ